MSYKETVSINGISSRAFVKLHLRISISVVTRISQTVSLRERPHVPNKDWDLGSIGNYKDYKYDGRADGPGSVTCGGLSTIQCQGVNHSEKKCGTDYAFSIRYSTPWLKCVWGNILGDILL